MAHFLSMNIRFSYLYRDGANYKNFNEIVFSNPNFIDSKEIEKTIRNKLIDGQWFICKEWNLPDMHFTEFSYDAEIDHDWHEFESIEETIEDVTAKMSIDDFLSIVKKTKLPW